MFRPEKGNSRSGSIYFGLSHKFVTAFQLNYTPISLPGTLPSLTHLIATWYSLKAWTSKKKNKWEAEEKKETMDDITTLPKPASHALLINLG